MAKKCSCFAIAKQDVGDEVCTYMQYVENLSLTFDNIYFLLCIFWTTLEGMAITALKGEKQKNGSREGMQPLRTGLWAWLSPVPRAWLATQVVAGSTSWLLTSSFPPLRTLFVTAVPSLLPPALPGRPALPSATLLPSAGCIPLSLAGAWRKGWPLPVSDRAARLPASTSPVPGRWRGGKGPCPQHRHALEGRQLCHCERKAFTSR